MHDYKIFKINQLDSISPTFCAAKWYVADFYLHTGQTSSCHLPHPDKIDLELAKTNSHYFNNTIEKIQQRADMLAGKKPSKCSNCWQVESASSDAISERTVYSYRFKDINFKELDLSVNQTPLEITVAFDTLCNFTCSYCDATQSSKWATELKTNGLFKKIFNDKRKIYQQLGTKYLVNDYNQVFELFLAYINEVTPDLQIITCLGGEPLISPNFWKFIEHLSNMDSSHIILTVVTNLSDIKNIKRLMKYKDKFKDLIINASIENINRRGEFVRAGLEWNVFESNLQWLISNNIKVNLLATCSGIVLDGLIEFLNWHAQFKNVGLRVYRLRYPNFQALQVLPDHLKQIYYTQLDDWIEANKSNIDNSTIEQLKNICYILNNHDKIYDDISIELLQLDAKEFYKQYAYRNKFDIKDIFSKELATWLLN
jgi:organic radical activating enzyme